MTTQKHVASKITRYALLKNDLWAKVVLPIHVGEHVTMYVSNTDDLQDNWGTVSLSSFLQPNTLYYYDFASLKKTTFKI